MVDTGEKSLLFNRINEEDVDLPRCIKLNDCTVYNYEKTNLLERNPNSCIEVLHAYQHDFDHDKSALASVLASLLAEPAFS